MKIIFDNGGQTCNKFWSYVPVLADCIKNKNHANILSYVPELKYYPRLKTNPYFRFPFFISFLSHKQQQKYTHFLSRIFRNSIWDIVTPLSKKFSKYFIDPWNECLDKTIEEETLAAVRTFFSPSEYVIQNIENDFKVNKSKDTVIVGVHIRRGDYESWLGGKYFFSLSQYANCCKRICSIFPGRIKFLLCSNEKVDLTKFNGLEVFQLTNSDSVHDLYGLSKCDYIIGPPSTYSTWASFIGEKPHSFIYDTHNFCPRFKVIKSHAKYEDGDDIIYHP